MTHPNITLIIADDHELIRDALKTALEKKAPFTVLATARNGNELIKLVKKHNPDVVITDIKMPVMDGIDATRCIRLSHPDISVMALTMIDNEFSIVEMLEAGALGYLNKGADITEIIEAVYKVYDKLPYYCSTTNACLGKQIAQSKFDPYEKFKPIFTEQEIRIIRLISKGIPTKQISAVLNIKPRTVDAHRRNILDNLQIKNSIGIMIYAIRHNLIKIEELP
jgi:two-component system, NarL family, response regulator NreC